jgi:S-adenosylmethionine/arginine decarboxylase-like enzyme
MFWKDPKGLKNIPMYSKIGISILLIVAGVGYMLGFATIYSTYSPIDEKPGMSVADIRIAFYGNRAKTRLEKAIDGSMRQYFADQAGYEATKGWIASGAREADFPRIKQILEVSCNTCHSAGAQVAGVVLAEYGDVGEYLQQDTGKSVSRLISLSHVHVHGTLPVMFALIFIFSFTLYKDWLKTVVIAFSAAAILIDVGSWWLAKLSGALAPLVLLGGLALALANAALILLPLYELWIKKA